MKILVVTQYFWPENFKINDLCDALIERGHEVTVYTGMPNYPAGEYFPGYSAKGPYKENLGKIKIIRVPHILRGKNKSLQLLFNYLTFCLNASTLAPFLVRGEFDKIFVFGPSPVTVVVPAIILKFLKKTPLFFWVQDLWPESLEATGVIRNQKILNLVGQFVKVLYKFSDRILVTSRGFVPKVKALGGRSEQIIYFPQWAESLFQRKLDPDFKDSRIPNHGFKIMFAGNIGTSQDFVTIVEAAKILHIKKEIFFLILGDGLMRSWAEEEVRKYGLTENFIFLGRKPLETMPDYYLKADVMLMSLTDSDLFAITVPAKLQGYLACGKPILASMNGEGASLVEEAKAGFTVPAGCPELLANAILSFSKKTSIELDEMGKNAKDFYHNNFDREVLLTFLEQTLEKTKF